MGKNYGKVVTFAEELADLVGVKILVVGDTITDLVGVTVVLVADLVAVVVGVISQAISVQVIVLPVWQVQVLQPSADLNASPTEYVSPFNSHTSDEMVSVGVMADVGVTDEERLEFDVDL